MPIVLIRLHLQVNSFFLLMSSLVIAHLFIRHQIQQLDVFVLVRRFAVGRYHSLLWVLFLLVLPLSLLRYSLLPRVVIPIEQLLELWLSK